MLPFSCIRYHHGYGIPTGVEGRIGRVPSSGVLHPGNLQYEHSRPRGTSAAKSANRTWDQVSLFETDNLPGTSRRPTPERAVSFYPCTNIHLHSEGHPMTKIVITPLRRSSKSSKQIQTPIAPYPKCKEQRNTKTSPHEAGSSTHWGPTLESRAPSRSPWCPRLAARRP